MNKLFTILFLVSLPFFSRADVPVNDTLTLDSFTNSSEFVPIHIEYGEEAKWKIRLVEYLKRNAGENNKAVAAVLAFPIFGIIGLHRIYLGTKPYVPVVYIATLGGCAGVLPLIDFFAILFANKEAFAHYKENPKVFMWITPSGSSR